MKKILPVLLFLSFSLFGQNGYYNNLKDALGKPLDVKTLDLSNKALVFLNKEISQFKNLETLLLTNNYLEELPASIKELQNLTKIDLTTNAEKSQIHVFLESSLSRLQVR